MPYCSVYTFPQFGWMQPQQVPASATRMVLAVQFLQTRLCDMGVNLRGGKVTVAEQHLHYPQIRPMVQQVSGKRMAQGMGEICRTMPASVA